MINTVAISDSTMVAEPLLHFIEICLYSGFSWMVADIMELMKGDTELSVKLIDCPKLFVSIRVNPGLSRPALNRCCIEVID